MSTSSYSGEPDEVGRRGGASPVMKAVAAGAAVAVLAFGATAIAKHGSSSPSSSSPSGGQLAPPGAAAPQNGTVPQAGGQGGPSGMFSPVTGATLSKLEAVATAKYPGTVEHAMRLPDGSYVVHVIQSSGQEVHVLVSSDFKVTGTDQGGPPASRQGQQAPGTGSATQS